MAKTPVRRPRRKSRLPNRRRARYLITGGVAANLHASVRATKDVDLLIPKEAANAKRVLDALGELPLGISRELDAEQVATRSFTIVGDMPRVDLLTVACPVTFEKAWPARNRESAMRAAECRIARIHERRCRSQRSVSGVRIS